MSTREVTSTSAATFASAHVEASPDQAWIVQEATGSGQPCAILDPDTVIRVNPMNRQYGGWNDAHFHPQLRLPLECNTGDGIFVTLQGTCVVCGTCAVS